MLSHEKVINRRFQDFGYHFQSQEIPQRAKNKENKTMTEQLESGPGQMSNFT